MGIMPRLYFPADPIQGAVDTCKTLAGKALDGTLQAALMDFAPALGQIGKNVVVATPDQLLAVETIIRNEPPACGDVAHFAVEHRNRNGCGVNEPAQPRLAGTQR